MVDPFDILVVGVAGDFRLIVELSLALDQRLTVQVVEDRLGKLPDLSGMAPNTRAVVLCTSLVNLDESRLMAITDAVNSLGLPVIVAVSTRVSPQDLDQYKRAGVHHVISAPFDPLSLAARVRTYIERRATL